MSVFGAHSQYCKHDRPCDSPRPVTRQSLRSLNGLIDYLYIPFNAATITPGIAFLSLTLETFMVFREIQYWRSHNGWRTFTVWGSNLVSETSFSVIYWLATIYTVLYGGMILQMGYISRSQLHKIYLFFLFAKVSNFLSVSLAQ